MKKRISSFLLFSVFVVTGTKSFSQNCDSKYLSITYKGTTFDTFAHARFTPEGELVSVSHLLDYNGSGHIARYSKNGTPLWSNYYAIGFFTFYNPTFLSKVHFTDFVLTDDGGMIVAGQVQRYYDSRTMEYTNQLALLSKINKYGIVEWSKTYLTATGLGDLSFSKIYRTTDGDIIAYMANDNGPCVFYPVYSYNKIIRFSATGELKWATTLYTGDFDAGGNGLLFRRGITQLTNKNIVIGDVVCKSNKRSSQFKINDGRIHFTSLDYNTGNIIWESNYRYTQAVADSTFVPDINFVSELPGGQLSFITSLYLNDPVQNTLVKRPVSLITDNRGVVQKLVAFHSSASSNCKLIDVAAGNTANEKNFLFQNEGTVIISSVTNDQTINWSKGYTGMYPANCLAAGTRGYGILLSDYHSLQYQLLLTDADGNVDCAETTVDIAAETILPLNDNSDPVVTSPQINTITNYKDYFVDYGYPLRAKEEYPLQQTTVCEQQVACCKDYVDTFNIKNVSHCQGAAYLLPDNNTVKDSGTYYVIYKTSGGCDSITYYKVTTDKNLSALTLGNDTCLADQNSIVLRATGGYGTYNWMGSISGASSFTINAPGKYWVSVTNICGAKTDSVQVFEQCNFPIYMPDAFTPNGDNLNDYFGVPEQNKNRLIELKIFNRWGQVVFETDSKTKKWDGKYKNQPLATGVFVYYLTMEGLSGNKITSRGKLLLIK